MEEKGGEQELETLVLIDKFEPYTRLVPIFLSDL